MVIHCLVGTEQVGPTIAVDVTQRQLEILVVIPIAVPIGLAHDLMELRS